MSKIGIKLQNCLKQKQNFVKMSKTSTELCKNVQNKYKFIANSCGMVQLKASMMSCTVCCQTPRLNLCPFVATKFSRQLMAERASCSLAGT